MKHLKLLTKKTANKNGIKPSHDIYAYESSCGNNDCGSIDQAICGGGATDYCQYEDYAACQNSSYDTCNFDYNAVDEDGEPCINYVNDYCDVDYILPTCIAGVND